MMSRQRAPGTGGTDARAAGLTMAQLARGRPSERARGGVRIFEGINFLSRSPTMSDEAMRAMFARAKAAGIAPYGATPEQMHIVPSVTESVGRFGFIFISSPGTS